VRVSSQGEFDPDEFDRLVDRHHGELRRFVRRRVSDVDAIDDILSETFCVAWRRRDDIPDRAAAWLMGVCSKVISSHERSGRRLRRLRGRLSSLRQGEGRDPAELVDQRGVLGTAFGSLSEAHREALRLVAWDGLSVAEAAVVCDCTPGAFRVRLHRARRELAKRLEGAGHEQVRAVADTRTDQR
jgi:RNA polymerase sigma-70 factor (ECF subfamily)